MDVINQIWFFKLVSCIKHIKQFKGMDVGLKQHFIVISSPTNIFLIGQAAWAIYSLKNNIILFY